MRLFRLESRIRGDETDGIPANAGDFGRHVRHINISPGTQNERIFNGVSEFPDIPRPGVGQQQVHRFGRETDNFLYPFFGVSLNKILNDNRYVLAPQKADIDNDIIYTNKFRLNMSARVNDQLNFADRLAVYKVFGDS